MQQENQHHRQLCQCLQFSPSMSPSASLSILIHATAHQPESATMARPCISKPNEVVWLNRAYRACGADMTQVILRVNQQHQLIHNTCCRLPGVSWVVWATGNTCCSQGLQCIQSILHSSTQQFAHSFFTGTFIEAFDHLHRRSIAGTFICTSFHPF